MTSEQPNRPLWVMGEDPVTKARPETINLEPTPGGYARMKVMMQESIDTYEQDIKDADVAIAWLDSHFEPFSQRANDAMLGALESMKEEAIESLVNLRETVAQLEAAGY